MRKSLLMVLFSGLGLAGCVAVPVYDPVGYGAPVVYAAPPPAVVVRPDVYSGFGYYGGRPYRGGHRRL